MNLSNDQIISQAMQILEERLVKYQTTTTFNNPTATRQFVKLRLATLEHEEFHVLYLNNQHGLIKAECAFTGTIDGATIYPREIVKRALQLNASAVIFAHNHPSGTPSASLEDKQITKRLQQALELVDIRTLDHLIVAHNEITSFAEQGLI